MKCPYCENEMLSGYIQCRDGVYWAEKIRPVAAVPVLSGNMINLEGEAGGGAFGGHAAVAYRCRNCKKVIIDYDKR